MRDPAPEPTLGADIARARARPLNWTTRRPAPRPRATLKPIALPQPEVPVAADPRLAGRLDALARAAEPIFREVAAAFDLSRYRSHADIGGGNGLLSCILAERQPRLLSRSCDLPQISVIAEGRIRERGLAGRVRAEPLDPYGVEFPQADVITLGHLLHDWNVPRRKLLIAKAWRALTPAGVLLAIETVVDPANRRADARIESEHGRAIELGDAFDITGTDFMRWAGAAGFRRCEVLALSGERRAILAFK